MIHIAEQGVIGLAFGAVAGIILMAILMWRGLPTENVALTTPTLGLLLGLIYGSASRPTRMQAVAKADQQLDLADLLGSALLVSDQANWASIVRSQADAVCQKLSPSDVILHRLGIRVWSGAGLASALLVALALIPTAANPALARQRSIDALVDGTGPELMQSAAALPRPTTLQADPDSSGRSRYGDESTGAKKDQIATNTGESGARPSRGNEAAGGRGTASSVDSHSAHLDVRAGKISSAKGQSTGRGSGMESDQGIRANSAGEASANPDIQRTPLPWRSDSWPSQVGRVRSDLKTGHLPDTYRDMLSGYFDAH